MKHFALFICTSVCTFILLIALSVWGTSFYLNSVQNQSGHLMQFMNAYLLQQAKRAGNSTVSDKSASQLASMGKCRVCFFSPMAHCWPIQIHLGKKHLRCLFQSAMSH
ncbi:MAG: hypothetical protein LKE53_06325 [Oscillospiraceae bacterium]|nr:hypothetical protein [Oscillospiraceae bacterium]MDD3260898.1 hypothetical protein [Oscillospiraceae bacterium]